MEPDRDRLTEQARQIAQFRVELPVPLIAGHVDEMERRTKLDQHPSQQEHEHT
jgi:hypothetical protein